MLLVIIFCTLYWGIRYSLWSAVIAGLLKDAFGIEPFGTYLFIYIAAAYLTVWIRQNVYQPGSRFSRAVVAFLVLVTFFVLEFVLHTRTFEVRWAEAFSFIFVPQTVVTMTIVTVVFQNLRDLAVKFRL